MGSASFTIKHHFETSIFLSFAMIHLSKGNSSSLKSESYSYSSYDICKNNLFSCGNVTNIGYPFWGAGRPEYCGRHNFNLSCLHKPSHGPFPSSAPYIAHMGTTNGDEPFSAMIININTSSRTMLLVQNPFTLNYSTRCQSLIRNETVIDLAEPYQFTPLVTNITLFFNQTWCDDDHNNDISSILDLAYARTTTTSSSSRELCSTRRVFPVFKSELDELNKGKVSPFEVLHKGFEVEYTVNNFDQCSDCEESGGVCGSTNDTSMKFTCYCPHGHHHHRVCSTPAIKLVIIGSTGLTVVVMVSLIIYCKRRRLLDKFSTLDMRGTKENHNVEAFLKAYGSLAPKRYRYTNIKKIGNSFKDRLGEGGFGNVYKGKLQDGRLVAVKLLNRMKGNGEDFLNEVLSISRTNHVNVVTLLGFCLEGNKRALIYEYLANGSLDKFICERNTHPSLPWETLFKIAVGIGRGLNYLHTGCNARILHFDIKPHNVLLDEEFCPKISDFGLAKLCPTKDGTVSMLEARGTVGYIAPEVVYRDIGGVSHKSDVYSYGMMVLDMACGRRNLSRKAECGGSEVYFPEWIFNQLEQREVATHEVQRKMILVSLWCIQKYPSDRPSMSRVLEMIEGPLESLPVPSRGSTVYI